MRKFIIILLLMTAMPAISFGIRAEKGHYELAVGEFVKLQIDDNVNVVWRNNPDSAGFIRFHGQERFADAFIFTNKNGKLKIQVSVDDANHPDLPTLFVYSNYLTEIKSSSSLQVEAAHIPSTAEVQFVIVGNGSISASVQDATKVEAKITTGKGVITLEGKCREARFQMLGTGQIRADRLVADDVNCTIMGTGAIYTCALKSLSTKGIGSTRIYYSGNPAEISKKGGGKLISIADRTAVVNSQGNGEANTGESRQPAATATTEGQTTETELTEQQTEEEEEEVEEAQEEEEEEEEEEPISLPERRN